MIDINDEGRVRTITFRRPEAKNAFSPEMLLAIHQAARQAAKAPRTQAPLTSQDARLPRVNR
mgnify:CR=1 FL=1